MMNRPQWVAMRHTSGAPAFLGADTTSLLTAGVTIRDWDNHVSGRYVDIPAGCDYALLGLLGKHATDPDAGTCTTLLWAAHEKGPALYIGSFAWVIGKQAAAELPYPPNQDTASTTTKWADTVVVTSTSIWPTDPAVVSSAGDKVVLVKLPTWGATRLITEITAVGTGITVMPVMLPLCTS